MRSSMWKTTLREIKGSLGRYLAILAIVALGVGFFSGLMVTTPAMKKTGGNYLNSHELFDVRLVSTLGFEKDATGLFTENPSVEEVEGAYSADFIAQDETGESMVLTAQTLLAVQNQVEVVAGRLPEAADEFVGDSSCFGQSDIGKTYRISEENEEETVDMFAAKEYKLVGTVQASYYANYDRGTSSLGNGKIAGFVYLLPEGFDCAYYTEIFVRLSQDYEMYSDEYKAAVDELKAWAEPLVQEAADQRYDAIMQEANEKIADAEAELSAETADARQELADAKKELDDGEAEIADGKEQLVNGEQQISDAKAQLAQKQQELDDSAKQLAAMKEQLQALDAGDAMVQQQLLQIEACEAQVEQGRQQLADAREEIAENEASLEESRQELAEAEEKLAEGKAEYEDGLKELEEKTAEAKKEIADAKEELSDIEKPDTYVLGRDTNVGYASFESDADIVAGIARVIPIFFFLVAALVCVTTMNRMVEEQRTQIGVLKALGYSKGRIMGKYLFYSGSAAVIGCVAGYVGGCIIFPTVIWEAYRIMYQMGDFERMFDLRLAVISLIVSLLCSVGVTWWTCRYELEEVAAQLMRPKMQKNGKRIWLEHIPLIWKRLSFLVKVSLRNVFRYRQRFIMMVLGIGGCTALLLTGFGIRDSVTNVASQQYGEIQIYDMAVTLNEDFQEGKSLAADGAGNLDEKLESGMEDFTPVSEKSMDLTGSKATKSATVVIPKYPEEMSAYIDLHTSKREPIEWPKKGEAVLSGKLAERCGIKVGDTISLRNEDGEKLTVKVVALARNFVYNYVYISLDTWEECNGSAPEYKSVYINAREDADLRELSGLLLEAQDVSAVTVNEDFLGRVDNMMKSLDYVVALIILCAGALAFIVIYNLTNINITERVREIATIKVLGFYPGETASYVFRENVVLTAIGAAAGIGMGVLLHRFVIDQIDIDMISFDTEIAPMSYLLSIVLTFVFMAIVDVAMYLKLGRIDMAESLKSVE